MQLVFIIKFLVVIFFLLDCYYFTPLNTKNDTTIDQVHILDNKEEDFKNLIMEVSKLKFDIYSASDDKSSNEKLVSEISNRDFPEKLIEFKRINNKLSNRQLNEFNQMFQLNMINLINLSQLFQESSLIQAQKLASELNNISNFDMDWNKKKEIMIKKCDELYKIVSTEFDKVNGKLETYEKASVKKLERMKNSINELFEKYFKINKNSNRNFKPNGISSNSVNSQQILRKKLVKLDSNKLNN